MITQMLARETSTALSDASTNSLYASAVVLTLAMLSFGVDLAQSPARAARESARRTTVVQDSADGAGDGSTAVLTRTETGEPAVPEKRQWAGIGMSLSWLGAFLLIACVVLRGAAVHRPPLGNMYEFATVGAAFTIAAYLLWSLKRDVRWLGIFVVGPVLLVEMLAAMVFYTDATQLMPSLKSYWLSIHVTVATLSIALFTIGFSLTLLHLIQERVEAGSTERFAFMKALPSSERLERLGYSVHIIAFPLWTFTLIAGAIWAQEAWGHYWNWDPKEVWTFVIWVVYAAYLHARVTAGWNSRRASYIALAGFACIIVNYCVVNVFFVGQHSYSGL
ncbi:c-type cytochrome biogenesis protein CcsB [Luteipulveratus sp. YIM 133132]|uniref:C-type cytochrome biogenesis protein CcsB n=1 Tax=Luteipulveratus flavus TaxID=3031728 RepID=A0ABT6C710_9MICO|nr:MULTISPECIES: c-type cytochrome biogenesis protein CcsB [unclassified Luteipulveratus]MDE9365022.1 c-type cytochrome biogenesis protein CcsB [Luteipulveratus sp. YIM 133132]MDF8264638.1 c-type cytochrome biogenesis protein CcsB [Luteipulveratus sp. YIM 133296]